MSGGGVENNWRLGGGMDILFYFIYLFIDFFFFFNNPVFFGEGVIIFSSSYTGYGPLQFKVIIYLQAVTSSFS